MARSCSDVNETQHFTFIWTLENMCESFTTFDSPTFTVKEMEMTKWFLTISMGFSECIRLDIWREVENDGPKVVEIKFELSFLGIDGLPLIEKGDIGKFETADSFDLDEFANKHEVFVRRRAEFLPKEALTVRCRMWRTGTEISQIDSCFARTLLRPDRHSFVWAIREFSTLQRNEMRKILLKKGPSNEWTLNLFVTENDGEEYLSISLQSSDKEGGRVKISLLDFEGKVVHFIEKKKYYGEVNKIVNFIEKKRLINDAEFLVPNNVMELRFEIEEDAKIVWSRIENYRYFNSKSYRVDTRGEEDVLYLEHDETSDVPSSFTEGMKSLQEEGTLSDVSLRTDYKSFPAHKCILSAHSPVFKAMFTGDMKEKTSKYVEIPDVDEDTLGEFLSYIYTGKVRYLNWQGTLNLYRAADKYELLDLKRKCANFLKSDLSTSNVCAIFNVADLHLDTELREAAQDFAMQEGKFFFTTDTWRNFKNENSKLACELVEHMYCNMKRQ